MERRLINASTKLQEDVQAEVEAAAIEFVGLAKRDLASQGGNTGTLLRSISYAQETPYSYKVSANAFYAPFIEFGTKRKYNPYPGTEEFAAQYRGKVNQGNWIDMLMSIYQWVKRKGIGVTYNIKTRRKNRQTADQKLAIAYAITMSILRNGINPKPFFFKQIPIVMGNLTKRINLIMDGI